MTARSLNVGPFHDLRITSLIPPAVVVLVTFLILFISYDQSDGDVTGSLNFFVLFLTFVAVYSIFTLGLNIQWGYTGVFNFGVLAFFMVGAYTTAIVTKGPSESEFTKYIGGWGEDLDIAPFLATDQWFPFLVGTAAAGLVAGVLAFFVAIPTLRLREDYLAIATIGIAEFVRRIIIAETDLFNGTRGLTGIPVPLNDLVNRSDEKYLKLALAIVLVMAVFLLLERAVRSPWGRVLLGIREDELTTAASGKDVFAFKTQSFVLGAVIMGIGGSMYAYVASSFTADTFTHFFHTFIFWAMLIVGGSGNNKGAIVGAYVLWGFWTITSQVQGYDLGSAIETRIPYVRDLTVGTLIVVVLLLRPQGLLPQERRVSIWVERRVRSLRRAGSGPGAAAGKPASPAPLTGSDPPGEE
jgi:branched-chain amino acid transport system permease protein